MLSRAGLTPLQCLFSWIWPFCSQTTAFTATTTSPICLECGIIPKVGKPSCCGRGGSWFGTCRTAENGHFGHTWYEGIRACEPRNFQAAMGHQLHAWQPQSDIVFDDDGTDIDSSKVILAVQIFACDLSVCALFCDESVAISIELHELFVCLVNCLYLNYSLRQFVLRHECGSRTWSTKWYNIDKIDMYFVEDVNWLARVFWIQSECQVMVCLWLFRRIYFFNCFKISDFLSVCA